MRSSSVRGVRLRHAFMPASSASVMDECVFVGEACSICLTSALHVRVHRLSFSNWVRSWCAHFYDVGTTFSSVICLLYLCLVFIALADLCLRRHADEGAAI